MPTSRPSALHLSARGICAPAAVAALALAVATVALSGSATRAQSLTTPAGVELTAEEAAERDGRKACKVDICRAFRTQAAGSDIACTVIKSWRKEQLDKLVAKARVSWPWGKVRCTADIRLARADLVAATSQPSYDLKLAPHTVKCTVDREKDTADISFSFAPKVKFTDGKAVKAALNWGEIKAPTLVKSAMWAATATDNTFNVLESTLVEDINDFIGAKCDEVKSDWQTP